MHELFVSTDKMKRIVILTKLCFHFSMRENIFDKPVLIEFLSVFIAKYSQRYLLQIIYYAVLPITLLLELENKLEN